jgi:hypothetical protein
MLNKLIFFILFLSNYAYLVHCQDLHWAHSAGGIGNDVDNSVFADTDGNVYVTGRFQDTVDFDPGPGVFSLIALGSSDAFVTKFDKYGNHIWSIKFGGINSFATNCHSLSVDDSGNVLITGSFSYTVDFDPGPGIYNLSSSGGNNDAFICKLNSSGSLQWAISFGNNSWDFGLDVTTDSFGNIYATGSFSGSVDFDPGPGAFIYSTITGASHTYILKLTSAGNFIWAKQFGAGWSVGAYTLKLDNLGNIYTSGEFAGICDFNPGSPTFYLTSFGIYDGFIAKLDNNGEFIFAKQIGGTTNDKISSMTMDQYCNLYTTGNFGLTADFDPGPGIENMSSYGQNDIFIAKYDSAGNYLWAKQIGDTLNDAGSCILSDQSGYIYITGFFEGTVDFNPGLDSLSLISDSVDAFISKFDSASNFIWVNKIGGPFVDAGGSFFIDKLNTIYLTGVFQDTVDFDLDTGSVNLVSSGLFDVFIAKYRQCSQTNSTLFITACDHYESPSGNYIYLNSGVYNDTILNVTGCDSLIEINLTITPASFVTISAFGSTSFCQGDSVTLSANPGLTSYQWYQRNYAIPGAINMNYVAKNSGRYKCIAQNATMCSDTSNIIIVNVPCIPIGPNQERTNTYTEFATPNFKISPNPGTGIFSIQSPPGQLKVFNSIGQMILSLEIYDEFSKFDITDCLDGIYFVTVSTGETRNSQKIILSR